MDRILVAAKAIVAALTSAIVLTVSSTLTELSTSGDVVVAAIATSLLSALTVYVTPNKSV